MSREIRELFGCLESIKTRDADARRRWPGSQDEDRSMLDMADASVVSPYFVDAETKLLVCKAKRRLQYKTQVFTVPNNAHVRTRASHTDEVVSIAVRIAHILGLNVDLTRAIALGHDIGHTPYGHCGEKVLSHLSGRTISHAVLGVVVAQKVERKCRGLNLTYQVLDGILRHSRGDKGLVLDAKSTPEAMVVMYADKIAYTFSDFNDFKRVAPYLVTADTVKAVESLGGSQRERVERCVTALCIESAEVSAVKFAHSEEAQLFEQLRMEMYKLYPEVDRGQLKFRLHLAFSFVFTHLPELDPALVVALMTDEDVDRLAQCTSDNADRLFSSLSVADILSHLKSAGEIDITNPDLDW